MTRSIVRLLREKLMGSLLACVTLSTVLLASTLLPSAALAVDSNDSDLQMLIQSACIDCHNKQTETGLDLTSLSMDFQQTTSASHNGTFRQWVRVFDRVQRGEMPPASADHPAPAVKQAALEFLGSQLKHVNQQTQQSQGRVPSRRLTRQEYENTLHDLLGIGGDLAKHLPPENESAAFDVVAARQEMSSVHVRALLKTADLALDEAIQLGPKPNMSPRELDYANSRYFQMWVDRPVRRGGGTVFKIDQDVVTFRGANYVLRSDYNGLRLPVAGRYRITIRAAAYQPRSSISVSLKRQNDAQGESELCAAWDLTGEDYRAVSTTVYLRPDDFIYVSADELEPAPDGRVIYNAQPASEFGGEGVRINRCVVQGPLESTWPPERTRKLFPGISWQHTKRRTKSGRAWEPVLTKPRLEHAHDIIAALAPRAFRRPATQSEIDALVALAKPALDANKDFVNSMRIAFRALLVSPQLLFQTGEAGPLNDLDLASRLSFFLLRSAPDRELLDLAAANKLSDPETLATQVDRLLNDDRNRFVHEFVDQWLELKRIDATSPDAYLYPEYDDVLRNAMLAETREFFAHLIEDNLGVKHVIDADFTFLNRKLAEHYGIKNVTGETMRRVSLPPDSIRGGILSHASIAKVTANGTVTSPVKRGNFVLTNLLGQPPNPPPPGIGAIEPDTRGATTIRETLKKHQAVQSCANCHQHIDPPGFALECFDPVGNFRQRYRNSRNVKRTAVVGLRFLHKDYDIGRKVDSSGITQSGFEFTDFRQYRKHLSENSQPQIARHILSQLIVFATGGEIEFADRDEVERILMETQPDGYRLRSLIHQVVKSRLFRNR